MNILDACKEINAIDERKAELNKFIDNTVKSYLIDRFGITNFDYSWTYNQDDEKIYIKYITFSNKYGEFGNIKNIDIDCINLDKYY